MARTFSNNAESTLASGILAGATSLTVATGDGAEFPATGDFTVRIEDASVSTSFELVTCTARSGDVLTISATAGAWDAGDKVFHVVAKADLDAFLQTGTQASAIVVNPTVNGADDVQEALTDKVHLTGDQTVAGIKTFSSIPVGPASDPTTDNQLARKAYVDAQAGGGGATIVRKTADETVNNSATLQNDDHLLFAVEANAVYLVELFLLLSAASGTTDFKFGWSVPSGTTVSWGPDSISSSTVGTFISVAVSASPALLQDAATSASIGAATGTTGAKITAIVVASATTGNVVLQWAQNTAGASDNKVLTNSLLRYERIDA